MGNYHGGKAKRRSTDCRPVCFTAANTRHPRQSSSVRIPPACAEPADFRRLRRRHRPPKWAALHAVSNMRQLFMPFLAKLRYREGRGDGNAGKTRNIPFPPPLTSSLRQPRREEERKAITLSKTPPCLPKKEKLGISSCFKRVFLHRGICPPVDNRGLDWSGQAGPRMAKQKVGSF
ncbi:hypothetical protein VTK73DRAFT_2650 [Phialemonium thermophilum]|uniref:Uncharacterized protein n=1 Tax=Phialemonium thermophilum TaxID=223376 RepID=A0ABR3X3Z1_9PEZI